MRRPGGMRLIKVIVVSGLALVFAMPAAAAA